AQSHTDLTPRPDNVDGLGQPHGPRDHRGNRKPDQHGLHDRIGVPIQAPWREVAGQGGGANDGARVLCRRKIERRQGKDREQGATSYHIVSIWSHVPVSATPSPAASNSDRGPPSRARNSVCRAGTTTNMMIGPTSMPPTTTVASGF